MRLLYGRPLEQTYADVARRIPEGASVVDLCCGTGRLYPRSPPRRAAADTSGSTSTVTSSCRPAARGVPTRFFNVLADPIPEADYVVMLSSLYHFRSRAGDAARTHEGGGAPGRDRQRAGPEPLAARSLLGRVASRLTNPGVGEYRERFDLAELRALASAHGATEFLHRDGDRNAIAVFRRNGVDSRAAA